MPVVHNTNICNNLFYLSKHCYRPSRAEIEKCNFYDNDKSAVTLWSENELNQPGTLLRASRVCVREQLHSDIKRKVYKLPIPQKLREDLLLENPYLLYSEK